MNIMLDSLEDKCLSDRNPDNKVSKLHLKIKYLEKENSDLQLDLEDVENTLKINKEMIAALMDQATQSDDASKNVVSSMRAENTLLQQQILELKEERDQLKDSNLLLEQIKFDMKSKEEETIAFYDGERNRVIEAMEK